MYLSVSSDGPFTFVIYFSMDILPNETGNSLFCRKYRLLFWGFINYSILFRLYFWSTDLWVRSERCSLISSREFTITTDVPNCYFLYFYLLFFGWYNSMGSRYDRLPCFYASLFYVLLSLLLASRLAFSYSYLIRLASSYLAFAIFRSFLSLRISYSFSACSR